jgi:hypothetical protein
MRYKHYAQRTFWLRFRIATKFFPCRSASFSHSCPGRPAVIGQGAERLQSPRCKAQIPVAVKRLGVIDIDAVPRPVGGARPSRGYLSCRIAHAGRTTGEGLRMYLAGRGPLFMRGDIFGLGMWLALRQWRR